MTTITKTHYTDGIQCPAYLWIKINDVKRIPKFSDAAQHRMDEGNEVGQLAKGLYPKGVDLEGLRTTENLKETEKQLKKRVVLFEAGIKAKTKKGEIYARVDLLVPAKNDTWDIIEVKSSTKVKNIHLHDVSFQKYVLEQAGLKVSRCFIGHVNSAFIKKGKINPFNFITLADVSEDIKEYYSQVEDNIDRLFDVIKLSKCPKVTTEDLLNAEYSNVAIDDFYDSLPEENIFQLYNGRKKKLVELYEQGVIKIKDIPDSFKLTDNQQIQKYCSVKGCRKEDKDKIDKFLKSLKYPLYYLDFETFNTVMPKFDGLKPYQQMPFQFSLHIVKKPGEKPKQVSFLADGQSDPRPKFLQALKDNLGDKGDIIVYNESFEKRIIRECVEAFPEFKKWADDILLRIKDLLHPFKNFHFYDPKQEGSAGLKAVLPIFSDISYKDLVISNGEDASLSYLKSHFGEVPSGEKKKVREALLKYCELDTLAEVVLVKELGGVVGR